MKPKCSVGGSNFCAGVDGGHLDAADTFAFNASDLDVALITPVGVPGVLNEPVIKAAGFISAISNDKDAVVEVGAAGCGVQYTGCV